MRQRRRVCLSGSLGRSKTANISRHETRDLDGDAQVDCALRKRRERGASATAGRVGFKA